jgi:enoyl-CoA hydratase/carnithine racemase
VAPEQVLTEARTEAARLAALPRAAYAASKRSLRRQTIEHVRTTLDSNLEQLLKPPG